MIYVIDLDNDGLNDEESEDGVQGFYAYGPFGSKAGAELWGERNCSFFSVVRPWWEE